MIILWALLGPWFHFSDTWQLVINTTTTIITFLMVFLIQNTQNRDAKALHLKLDELLRSTAKARNSLVNLEDLTDDELATLKAEFEKVQLRAKVRAEHKNGQTTADTRQEDQRVPISQLRQN
jgi:low affinity Fe/Cu permease